MTLLNRRRFLCQSSSLAVAGLISSKFALTSAQAGAQQLGAVIDEQDFGRLQQVGQGVWAVVSTPLNAQGEFANAQTVCNGGFIAGDEKVLAIDAFLQPAGAHWMAEHAARLTGKRPTDVVVTHFHADHSGGLAGYQMGGQGPEIIATETTRKLINERYVIDHLQQGEVFARPAIRVVGPTQILIDESKPVNLDLGGRSVTIEPLSGHTPSDLVIHLDDLPIIFAGDLIWKGFFHNYVDAIPSRLRSSVEKLLKDPHKLIITGHGEIGMAGEMGNYLELLNLVEMHARRAHAAGKTAAEGAKEFNIPESLGNWILFNPAYYERAFNAWFLELGNL